MANTAGQELRIEGGDAVAIVSPEVGGRLASFRVGDRELLVTEGYGPMRWGCYPMVPFAGRIRHGRFEFGGRTHQLELSLPPHAIHGVVFDVPWSVVDDRTLSIELGPRWPFRGRVIERFDLQPDRLTVTLALEADEAMPAVIGWHPWFRRRLEPANGRDVDLRFHAERMFERDAEGIATGKLVRPAPHPWDDCFVDVRETPILTWPGDLELAVTSTCDYWVIYEEAPEAVCAEPQTGPPNAANILPAVVEPGLPLRASMEWRWRRIDG